MKHTLLTLSLEPRGYRSHGPESPVEIYTRVYYLAFSDLTVKAKSTEGSNFSHGFSGRRPLGRLGTYVYQQK